MVRSPSSAYPWAACTASPIRCSVVAPGVWYAAWPEDGTFHSLRHYFATRRLITSGADPTDVQNALRHSSLRITLETDVHWWPKKNRRRNIVSTALREAATNRAGSARSG